MAKASSLRDKEKFDENLNLVEFYEKQDYWLRNVCLGELPIRLKFQIAILFLISSKKDDTEWMIFLEELGLPTFFIYGIRSARTVAHPLFVAFEILENRENLGHVMEVFAQMQKFHILRHVKTYVERLLLEGRHLVQPTAPVLPISSCTKGTERKYEVAKESEQSPKSWFPNCNSPKLEKFPSNFNLIVVFIQHALSDRKYAVQLATELDKKGFRVLISDDIYPFLRMNRAQILRDLYRKVDFIVPLLSDELWKQINSRKEAEVDFETECNRFLYDLALRQYSKLLKNYRVRPVVTSRKINAPIDDDSILSYPFHFEKEFSQFIKNLLSTKLEYDRIKKC